MAMGDLGYLSGYDLLRFTPHVTPVAERNDEGELTGLWKVAPDELAYLLGPMAVAPPRTADPLPVQIEALIYAQNGSWFIIPGPWFNEDPDEDDYLRDYPGYHEPLNIKISCYGAITENMPADPGSVAAWTSKWAGPVGRGGEGFLSYTYDPLLSRPRWESRAGQTAGRPRFPNFPITSELLIWGERVSGAAEG